MSNFYYAVLVIALSAASIASNERKPVASVIKKDVETKVAQSCSNKTEICLSLSNKADKEEKVL